MTDEDAARSYVEAYKQELLKEGGEIYAETLTFTIQPQISFTVMDQTNGHVKVMVGGRGDKTLNRSLNRASNDIARQPGSSIKPLAVYGPALDTGTYSLAESRYVRRLKVPDGAKYVYVDGSLPEKIYNPISESQIQELMQSLLLTLQKVNTEV